MTLDDLVETLKAEQLDTHLFRGHAVEVPLPRVFGGQVLAQSLYAAASAVGSGRRAHSMHAYFLRPGSFQRPIIYTVDPIRDGRSFSTRRVVAMQDGRAIFNCAISFHEETKGLDHQNPEKEGFAFPEALSNPGLEDDDSLVHQLLLTFISDYGLVFTQRKRGIGASRRVYSSDTDYINETVTAWQEGRGFTLALHTDDGSAPAPFREAAFTYELRAVGEARTLLQTRLLITMRGGAVGEWLARKVMAGTFESRLDAVSGGLKRLYESDHTSAMPGF